jgi:hypothetical protein
MRQILLHGKQRSGSLKMKAITALCAFCNKKAENVFLFREIHLDSVNVPTPKKQTQYSLRIIVTPKIQIFVERTWPVGM